MGARVQGRILLVEDEPLLRGLIAHFLRAENFEIVEAEDGCEAVQRFSSMGPFDLVLLDLNLPVLSGVEVCQRIKYEQPGQAVIICSAAILDGHTAALSELDVDQFLTKPYHPTELLGRIGIELNKFGKRLDDWPSEWAAKSTRRSDQGHEGGTPSHTLVKQTAID